MKEVVKAVNLDANESAFFARELEAIKARTYDVQYPEYKAVRLIPVSTEAGSGAESITYRQFDSVGLMKVIANYADDLPRSDVFGKEFTSPIRSLGGSYGWNLQEVRAAAKARRPLTSRKADAARMSYEQKVNRIGWFARPADGVNRGLTGLLYNPNVTSGAATTGSWGSATTDQIIGDVNDAINDPISLTKGVEVPNTVLLPVDKYTQIASTPRSTTSDTTILEFLRRVHPGVTFEWVNELSAVDPAPSGGSAPTNIMIAYRRDPMKLTYEIPQPFEQLPVQERGLEYVVPTHARNGGVIVYYPLSVNIVEGI